MINMTRNAIVHLIYLSFTLGIMICPYLTDAQIITTIAGNGIGSYSGDGGMATAAGLHWPVHTVMDGSGNIYLTDYSNNRIRKINTSGIISTYAGNGFS